MADPNIGAHSANKNSVPSDNILNGDAAFNDLVMPYMSDRISQELDNITSTETKSSIIIATCLAIFAIFTISGNPLNLESFYQKTITNQIFVIITWASFVFSFILGLVVVFPTNKLKLIDPRALNNGWANKGITESKIDIKKSLITNFEYIQKHRIKDALILQLGFVLLAIGFFFMVVGMIFFTKLVQ